MLYVQQSLGPKEEILMGGRFHWMYTMQAVGWILFGLGLGIAVGYTAIWWVVTRDMGATLTQGAQVPPEIYDQVWDKIVSQKGGYLKILWGLHPLLRFGILGMFVLGLYFFAHMMIVKATTEIAVTSERLIYKKGLIARMVGELNVDRIEGVSVRQGVLGRIFGYGNVIIRGMGVGEVVLPPIESPIEFRRAVMEAQSVMLKSSGHNARNM